MITRMRYTGICRNCKRRCRWADRTCCIGNTSTQTRITKPITGQIIEQIIVGHDEADYLVDHGSDYGRCRAHTHTPPHTSVNKLLNDCLQKGVYKERLMGERDDCILVKVTHDLTWPEEVWKRGKERKRRGRKVRMEKSERWLNTL